MAHQESPPGLENRLAADPRDSSLAPRWFPRDIEISSWMNVSETLGWKRTTAILITRSGDAIWLLLVFGLLIALAPPFWKRWAMLMIVVDLINLLITLSIKAYFKRARPAGSWGQDYRKIDPHSFPSGHSSRGGALGISALLIGPVWLGVIGLIWGACIALSRVWTGVHYLSDAIAGYGLGLMVGALIILMLT